MASRLLSMDLPLHPAYLSILRQVTTAALPRAKLDRLSDLALAIHEAAVELARAGASRARVELTEAERTVQVSLEAGLPQGAEFGRRWEASLGHRVVKAVADEVGVGGEAPTARIEFRVPL